MRVRVRTRRRLAGEFPDLDPSGAEARAFPGTFSGESLLGSETALSGESSLREKATAAAAKDGNASRRESSVVGFLVGS